MYGGLGDDTSDISGPTPSQLGIETVQGSLTQEIQGATPGVQSYIADLENWINAGSGAPASSSSQSATAWLNNNSTPVLIAGGVGLAVLILMRLGR